MKKHLLISGLLVIVVQTSLFSQSNRKAAAYTSKLNYLNKLASDSFFYSTALVDSEFIDSLYRIFPKDKSYSHVFLQEQAYIVFDGRDLFLNLRKLRMSRGFKKLSNPRMYHAFDSRPPKPSELGGGNVALVFGVLGGVAALAADGINNEIVTREKVWYILNRSSGQVYPMNSATLDRIMEPHSILFELYRIDPNREEFQTMLEYLDLLNGLIETDIE